MHPRFHAERIGARPAAIMSDSGKTLSYAGLERIANQGARLFRDHGLRSGDTVAIWLPNSLAWFGFYWAAQRAGLYVAPISTALNADDVLYIIADSGAKLLLTGDAVAALSALRARAPSGAPGLVHLFWADDPVAGLPSWAQALGRYPSEPIGDEAAGIHIVYSSGTTGRPKGIRLPLSGGAATAPDPLAERMRDSYGVDDTSVYLSTAPLYHTAPLVFATNAQRLGATVVVMRKFDPEAALAAIERFGVTFTQMVPTMFGRLLRLPDIMRARYDLSSLTRIIHAAAPCPVEVKRRMIAWLGPIIDEYYGGSERNGSTAITAAEWLRKPGSVGRANWGMLRICDEDGAELPANTPGLVYFEGGGDFEYLNDPAKTRDARHPAHPDWSTLGDIGYVDADGYLFLTDRKTFMIISGGVNIYPQEIEDLLSTYPGIADVAVVGVPDDDMGEAVKAVVQPLDWRDATPAFAAAIIDHSRRHLSAIKVPRSVDFDPALPRHETGKLYKRLVRDRYWADAARRI